MDRVIDRFDKYMKYKGLNDNKVTVQLGLSIGRIGKARKPGRDLSTELIESILSFYTDLDDVWLLRGKGEMIKSNNESSKSVAGKVEEPGAVYGQGRKEETLTTKELIETIRFLSETVNSLQKKIEQLEAQNKKDDAHREDNAGTTDVD